MRRGRPSSLDALVRGSGAAGGRAHPPHDKRRDAPRVIAGCLVAAHADGGDEKWLGTLRSPQVCESIYACMQEPRILQEFGVRPYWVDWHVGAPTIVPGRRTHARMYLGIAAYPGVWRPSFSTAVDSSRMEGKHVYGRQSSLVAPLFAQHRARSARTPTRPLAGAQARNLLTGQTR